MTTTTEPGVAAAIGDVLEQIDDDTMQMQRRPPFVTAIKAGALFADPAYQRQLDPLRVQRMVDEFDATLLGVLEVADRGDGTFAILDGQHRWATAADVDVDMHLVCQVHRDLTVEDEARVFYEIDVRRKPLSGWDRWKARRGAGDLDVLDIERVVVEAGLTVSQSGDGAVGATRALEIVFQAGGAILLHNTLTILTAAYGTARDAYDGVLLQAIAIVHESYDRDEVDQDRLISQLQSTPPKSIKSRAQALKEVHRAELPRLCAAVVIERYNAAPGRKVEDLLTRAPASGKLLSKAGRRHRELAAIRRWAIRRGHRLGDRGRLPLDVIDAYTEAHPGFVLSSK